MNRPRCNRFWDMFLSVFKQWSWLSLGFQPPLLFSLIVSGFMHWSHVFIKPPLTLFQPVLTPANIASRGRRDPGMRYKFPIHLTLWFSTASPTDFSCVSTITLGFLRQLFHYTRAILWKNLWSNPVAYAHILFPRIISDNHIVIQPRFLDRILTPWLTDKYIYTEPQVTHAGITQAQFLNPIPDHVQHRRRKPFTININGLTLNCFNHYDQFSRSLRITNATTSSILTRYSVGISERYY